MGETHKVVVEFTRNTDSDLPYAMALNPNGEESKMLGELVLDEISKSQLNENIEKGEVKIVQVIMDNKEVEKENSEAAAQVLKAMDFCRTVLTSNSLTENIRITALEFLESCDTKAVNSRLFYLTHPFTGGKFEISREQFVQIEESLKTHKKIPAIKTIRDLTQWGLKDAKDCADKIADSLISSGEMKNEANGYSPTIL